MRLKQQILQKLPFKIGCYICRWMTVCNSILSHAVTFESWEGFILHKLESSKHCTMIWWEDCMPSQLNICMHWWKNFRKFVRTRPWPIRVGRSQNTMQPQGSCRASLFRRSFFCAGMNLRMSKFFLILYLNIALEPNRLLENPGAATEPEALWIPPEVCSRPCR